jgi:hypothetical protein
MKRFLHRKAREKLAKIAGLLGSEHPGERASAALAGTRLLADAGWTWGELLSAAFAALFASAANAGEPADEQTALESHRQLARWALARSAYLSPWEVGFLRSIAEWHERPSAKQLATLNRIVARLKKQGR